MKTPSVKPVRCAIYTRVSTDHGLDQEFNSLDAQFDAASAIRSRYDDGGYPVDQPTAPTCNGCSAGSLRRSD
jgi:hypothetical protein